MVAKSKSAVGIIGLGLMGSALAERLRQAGFHVHGFDINPYRCALLRRRGGQPAVSAAAVAAATRRIVLSLMTTAQVERVLDEMDPELRRGSIIIDTSTGDPERMAKLGARLRRRGIHYLDAPIAGSSTQVHGGSVLVLVGGNRKVVRRCFDVFNCFAREVNHAGPCGHGARMKLVFNLALGLHRAALAEALTFADAIGVPPAHALEIMKAGAAYSRVMDTKGTKMLTHNFSPQAKLEQHLKDVKLILETGRRAGAKLPLSTLHRKLLSTLARAGHGDLDNSAIIKAFE